MTRVAAIDCGTNSIRLLVADVAPGAAGQAPAMTELAREMRVVRLGQGVDATGAFAPEALERTFRACEEYAAIIAKLAPERTRFVATSASRDVSNRDEFLSGVHDRLGVFPDVVSGDEEARLSFAGATSVIAAHTRAPYLVMDLGGGSTELVTGTDDVAAAFSMDVGSVRLTERFLPSDPPTAAQTARAREEIDRWYDRAARAVDVTGVHTVVGVAGTITTVAAAALRLSRYDREAIHAAHLPAGRLSEACRELTAMPRADRAALGFMHPGRVDVIGAGALLLDRLVARIRADVQAAGGEAPEFVVSESDILDGIALGLG